MPKKVKITKEGLISFFQFNKEKLLLENSTLKSKKEIFSLEKEYRNWYQYLINEKDGYSLKKLKEDYKLKSIFHTSQWVKMWKEKELKEFIKENKELFIKDWVVTYNFLEKTTWLSFLKDKRELIKILETTFEEKIVFQERRIKYTKEYVERLFNENKHKWSKWNIILGDRKLKNILSKEDYRKYANFCYYFSYYNVNYRGFIESQGYNLKIASKQNKK